MKYTYSLFIFLLFPIFLSAHCISGDCINGFGKYRFPSGAIYEGNFLNGEVHGEGVCRYDDGSIYQGQWEFRYPQGKGTKIYPDGKQWSGIWVKGKPLNDNGEAFDETMISKGASSYDGTDIQSGCIVGDCENGLGTFAYADGSKYEGQFKNSKKQGWGSFYFANGEKYTGDFKMNFAEGYGTMFFANGTSKKGNWYRGEFIKEEMISKGGRGCIEGNCVTGNGTYIYDGGLGTYKGAFLDGRPHGTGECVYANGEKYLGEWQNGGFHGTGTLLLNDGTKVSGIWQNGNLVRKENVYKDIEEASNNGVKIWAVIIGVSSYEHMHTLKYSDDDAYKVYAFLRSPEGGAVAESQIKILIDDYATRSNVLDALTETFNQAGENDMVVMYFSGHGLKGSFLPIDYDGFNNKIYHEEINGILQASPAKFKLLIADACHSGSLLTSKGSNPYEGFYKALAQSQPGMALIMSSKSEETSLESNNLRQGVFSHFLLKGLKGDADLNTTNTVTITELFNYISSNVKSYTANRQSPIIKGDYDPEMIISQTK